MQFIPHFMDLFFKRENRYNLNLADYDARCSILLEVAGLTKRNLKVLYQNKKPGIVVSGDN